MTQTQTIPETFLGVGYTRDRAGLPLEAVRGPKQFADFSSSAPISRAFSMNSVIEPREARG